MDRNSLFYISTLSMLNMEYLMTIRTKANVRLKFQSERQMVSLFNALIPEAEAPITRRAKVRLKPDGQFLMLSVDADDTVALRSTLNAYLRWINATVNVLEMVDHV
jgi:KEOPS complex subunit Pcc1